MAEDLSKYHAPVTELFRAPRSAAERGECRLTDEQLQFYEENGYLAGIRMLDAVQVEALRAELSELMNPEHPRSDLWYEFHSNESRDPSRVLFHALGAWRIAQGFHDLLWNPRFTVAASQLLGGAVRFWHDQLFCKPARHGGVVAWHQDYSYWTRTTPLAHLTCWVGLDDSTRENGCVHYVPGSQRWPDLPVTGLAGDMDSIQSVLTEEQKEKFKPVAIELKAGECSFHHPRMIHGSFANSTPRPRRATVINVFRDGVRSNSDAPPLEGVPPVPKGEPMGGRFFPLLFDPNETK
ncbi:MAG: phytanoyl-CoA dioxygenase family protein [Acidobacteriota bacterium]|nr:phytanoyl-CoA dioxygenase family protein [Acidobacteriota bacterium]MDQ5835907.1 phytanoyl-CoA dioxygenase family protein [Acidobacteriota bacterium]